jgi:hypothetical protein
MKLSRIERKITKMVWRLKFWQRIPPGIEEWIMRNKEHLQRKSA